MKMKCNTLELNVLSLLLLVMLLVMIQWLSYYPQFIKVFASKTEAVISTKITIESLISYYDAEFHNNPNSLCDIVDFHCNNSNKRETHLLFVILNILLQLQSKLRRSDIAQRREGIEDMEIIDTREKIDNRNNKSKQKEGKKEKINNKKKEHSYKQKQTNKQMTNKNKR